MLILLLVQAAADIPFGILDLHKGIKLVTKQQVIPAMLAEFYVSIFRKSFLGSIYQNRFTLIFVPLFSLFQQFYAANMLF